VDVSWNQFKNWFPQCVVLCTKAIESLTLRQETPSFQAVFLFCSFIFH